MASTVELTLRYTTVDVHCRDRTDECDRGIISFKSSFNGLQPGNFSLKRFKSSYLHIPTGGRRLLGRGQWIGLHAD